MRNLILQQLVEEGLVDLEQLLLRRVAHLDLVVLGDDLLDVLGGLVRRHLVKDSPKVLAVHLERVFRKVAGDGEGVHVSVLDHVSDTELGIARDGSGGGLSLSEVFFLLVEDGLQELDGDVAQ